MVAPATRSVRVWIEGYEGVLGLLSAIRSVVRDYSVQSQETFSACNVRAWVQSGESAQVQVQVRWKPVRSTLGVHTQRPEAVRAARPSHLRSETREHWRLLAVIRRLALADSTCLFQR